VNRLRNRLILVFVAATLLPLIATVWITTDLMRVDQRLGAVATARALSVARQLKLTSMAYFRQVSADLKRRAQSGELAPQRYPASAKARWPEIVRDFAESGETERFSAVGDDGNRLEYLQKHAGDVWVYFSDLDVPLSRVGDELRQASLLERFIREHDLPRGTKLAYILLAASFWLTSLGLLVFLAHRISRPIHQLTRGLAEMAAGDLSVRVQPQRDDEVGRAIQAFNDLAGKLKESTERLLYLRQLESWQSLARKTAHEVKNSLTPIRLTVEEMLARYDDSDRTFMQQATQIVVDEIETLERRVRAFSNFATEPPVSPAPLDVNSLLQERIALLGAAHPEVAYECRLEDVPQAMADPDLVKGILTNLLENAAEAAGHGGRILGITSLDQEKVAIEVHDSGPGLSEQARSSLFQPTISFKKRGMGLGLSIARKSARLSGGDILVVKGELGGAGFRVLLPVVTNGFQARPDRG
jgi:nitrogen fixation/metabolism regulation signal transduction histidine kinase